MSAPTRRSLLGGAAILAAAPALMSEATSAHPDAELLAACAAHDELERAYLATGFSYECGTPEYDAAEDYKLLKIAAQQNNKKNICEAGPVTWEGHAARARTLALCDPDLFRRASDYTNEAMLAAIVRDLIGVAGA